MCAPEKQHITTAAPNAATRAAELSAMALASFDAMLRLTASRAKIMTEERENAIRISPNTRPCAMDATVDVQSPRINTSRKCLSLFLV